MAPPHHRRVFDTGNDPHLPPAALTALGISYGAFIVPRLIMLSVLLGLLIFAIARLFVDFDVQHPFWALGFLVLTAVSFSLFGFILGIWATGWEKLQVVPIMIVTPLTFLGGSFDSIAMLPPFWQQVTLFNPVVYRINGFRWSFYGVANVSVAASLGTTLAFTTLCFAIVWWVFRTRYRLKA